MERNEQKNERSVESAVKDVEYISDIGAVRTIVEQMLARSILDVVLSPGSRNAPFVLSFTSISEFRCLSVLDERSAGFVALGMAQQSRRPVALSCTSGSAVLNYAPALVEAFYQRIPLVAITADRPAEWVDQGEGQTIRQNGLLDGIGLRSFNLVSEHTADDEWFNRRMINEALEWTMEHMRPVHINVPLHEPLYRKAERSSEQMRSWRKMAGNRVLQEQELDDLKTIWSDANSVLILCAQGTYSDALAEQLRQMSDEGRVVVLTETTANLCAPTFVHSIDRTCEAFLNSEAEKEFVPDLLITLGENLISKKFKAFLRRHRYAISHHWHFGTEVMDTYQSLTRLIESDPAHVLRALRTTPNGSFAFSNRWRERFYRSEMLHEEFVQQLPWSDMAVYRWVFEYLPEHWQVQMGNSSVVRYVQLFQHLQGVRYFGNRGVSGIEGCTSTAIGAAMVNSGPVLLITGDLSFAYDSNAWRVRPLPQNLVVIIVNNEGGNIFRIIDGPGKDDATSRFIEHHIKSNFEDEARLAQADYYRVNNQVGLIETLESVFAQAPVKRTIIEVQTPREDSPEILKQYFKHLAHGNA